MNKIKNSFINFFKSGEESLRFSLLIVLYIFKSYTRKFFHLIQLHSPIAEKIYDPIIKWLDRPVPNAIARIELIDMAFKNLGVKKARSNITIGGMAIGVSIVVLLVSIGYGLENMVVSRIAKLDELVQINVSTQVGSKVKIDDSTINTIYKIPTVTHVYPMIAVACKVDYQNSQSDVAAYGINKEYLSSSSINPVTGSLFQSNSKTNDIIVNTSLLKLVGIDQNDPLNKVVSLRFVVTKGLLNSSESQLESDNTNYTIIGVLNDDSQPIVYAPIQKIMAMGVTNYSGLKVIVKNQDSVTNTRIQIESLGLDTASVIDTIKQVTDLFSTVRLVLASIGMVALVVASLGMFNTLTISLLERTHEIGLMKTMGMKSFEIYKLFLSESLVIGVLGGFFGLILGFLAGKLLSITLSLIVINKNVGYIDVSQIPLVLVALVGVLSLIVGVFTGIYPAKRATRISALDALRYE